MALTQKQRKLVTVGITLIPLAIMTVLVSESVTLYRLFCGATGFGGTTQRVSRDSAHPSMTTVKVRFDANVAPQLPWKFYPLQNQVTVNLGAEQLVYFEAENPTGQSLVGHAAFNVTPQIAGLYFKKIQCFCFTDERLDAHAKIKMPVVFFVDPKLESTPDGRDVKTITLSYTFFRTPPSPSAKDLARFLATTKPNPEHGKQIFGTVCEACHGLDKNKEGPMLAGVVGRRAGTVPGYSYSPALKRVGFIWTAGRLDRWLAYPQGDVPGAYMPVKVENPVDRRDVIAYLEEVSGKAAAAATPDAVPSPAPAASAATSPASTVGHGPAQPKG
ncbi:MAG TPA: cytochrome c oxidase assembly protein [Alphaproteobacteria bacterium]|nr:cytochrome c oxidase assembly protein [Alphaproteobacteria bacterium]